MQLTNEQWLDVFASHLMARGAAGTQAGQALAEVRAHLADSGEQAMEAFGDPAAYASALDIKPGKSKLSGLVLIAGTPLAIMSSIWVIAGIVGLASGRPVTFSYFDIAAWIVGGLGAVAGVHALISKPEVPFVGLAYLLVAFCAMVVLTIITGPNAIVLPPGASLGIGLVLGCGWLTIVWAGHSPPILDPVTGKSTDAHGRPAAKSYILLVIFAVIFLIALAVSWWSVGSG